MSKHNKSVKHDKDLLDDVEVSKVHAAEVEESHAVDAPLVVDHVHHEPVKVEHVPHAPVKVEHVPHVPVKVEHVHHEPVKTDHVHHEHHEPFKVDHHVPVKVEHAHLDHLDDVVFEDTKLVKVKGKKTVKPTGGLKLTPSSSTATLLSDIVTTVKNITSNTLPFGFIPPHGKELTAGETVTIAGDLYAQLSTGGRTNQRKVTALNGAISDRLVRVSVNTRKLLHCPVASATVVAVGDLMYWDSGTSSVKPASLFTWTSNLATTQANFANVFVGVAVEAHASGAASNIKVDVSPTSVYSYTCTSETHLPGDFLGPAKASGNALVNQTLVKAVAASSVATALQIDTSAATLVSVRFQSAYWDYNTAGAM